LSLPRRERRGRFVTAAAMLLTLGCGVAACAPTAGAAGGGSLAPSTSSLAWVGEDPARGLRVVLEVLPRAAGAAGASADAEAPLRDALDVAADEDLFLLHLLQAPADRADGTVRWGAGAALRAPAAREDASPRARLLHEALVRGGSASLQPRRSLLAGPAPAGADAVAEWRGVEPPLPLTPRLWSAAERAACLDARTGSASSHD
jgi:hypothetical protein